MVDGSWVSQSDNPDLYFCTEDKGLYCLWIFNGFSLRSIPIGNSREKFIEHIKKVLANPNKKSQKDFVKYFTELSKQTKIKSRG